LIDCRAPVSGGNSRHAAEALYRELDPAENHDFELRHKAIVDRFGRHPHSNDIPGRTSTPEELEFLRQPGSRFRVPVVCRADSLRPGHHAER